MQKSVFLDKVLKYYKGTFDIEMNKEYAGMCFMAYGHYYMTAEKYFVTQGTKLYGYSGYEYLFFWDYDTASDKSFEAVESFIKEYAEPVLVRKNKKYPHKEHMYSYITIIVLHDEPLPLEFIRRVKRFKFNKSYLFSFRGYMHTRIVCAGVNDRSMVSNSSGRGIKKLYTKILDGKKIRR